MRGATNLWLKLSLVGLGTISIFFTVYGIKMRFFLITDAGKNWAFDILFLSVVLISLLCNYLFISRSSLLSGSMRRTTTVACSVAATFFTLFCAMLLCVNTFGE